MKLSIEMRLFGGSIIVKEALSGTVSRIKESDSAGSH